MSITHQRARGIKAGFAWRLQVRMVTSPVMAPVGATFKADVRTANPPGSTALVTLTTADSTITRIDDDTLELLIPGNDSATWGAGMVAMDVVRTDGGEPAHLGFTLRVPVTLPITPAT